MNAIPNELPADALPDRTMPAPVLRTLAICDLADSTALVEKLGDQRGAEVMRQHDRLARDLVVLHHGREIDKTDGFLILFERPIQAVAFALDYQRGLRTLSRAVSLPLTARIGIHVGDVVIWDNDAADVSRGAKPVEVEGLVKPTVARIMGIARPGQVLLSGIASALAQRARAELGDALRPRWQAHGNYRFKGLPEPVQVHEVGEDGIAPFRAPAWSGKAHREVPWWRRPGMLFVEAAVLVLALALPVYFSLRSPPAIAFAERDWVVVGDLRNLTGEGVLDESLDTAFRVSLEQSRFVNLVSGLQVRDALKRMQKEDGARVDRAIGAEIAMREGARALILPSVAEVGGRVRVTAEVIDPRTQATVYAETADGVGLESILPSVGKVSGELRTRLGEALASVEANNAPLPQVTTGNLDALRAYSMGLQAYAKARYTDALALYQQALKLDPNFALAYMGLARVYEGNADPATAKQYIDKALALRDRLTARDQLYLDAWSARFGPVATLVKKWQLLGTVYPDYYAAAYNTAYYTWHLANRADDAIAAIQPALSEHNPQRGAVFYTLGFLQAAKGDFAAAEESFDRAHAIGYDAQGVYHAAAFAAQRRFDDASKILDGGKHYGIATQDIYLTLERVTLDADRGDWQHAQASLDSAADAAQTAGPFYARLQALRALSLADLAAAPEKNAAALRAFVQAQRPLLAASDDPHHPDDVFAMLFAGYLAARAGDFALAQSALTAATPYAHGSGFPDLEHMLAVVEAELSSREGRPQDAIARLTPTLDGSELYLTHVALADAAAASHRDDDALREATWLRAHRGVAYLETNSFHVLETRNVVESDLALLRIAESERARGHAAEAARALTELRSIWPQAQWPAAVAARVARVEKA